MKKEDKKEYYKHKLQDLLQKQKNGVVILKINLNKRILVFHLKKKKKKYKN